MRARLAGCPEALAIVRLSEDNPGVANERYNSWLIDEGATRQVVYGSLGRTLLTAALLTLIGVLVVWALFVLLASA